MYELRCPSCGGAVQFFSKVSAYAVCPFCRSSVVRRDLNLEVIGEVAWPLNDTSPLQIGTTGWYQGHAFTLIGRLRRLWEGGFWNEWHAWFDGTHGWLAEAQGFYSISFESEFRPPFELHQVEAGQQRTLEGKSYLVTDIKQSRIAFTEGELPFTVDQDQVTHSVDFLGQGGLFACIEQVASGEPRLSLGHYLDYTDFRFERLRELEGWTP